MVQLVKCLPQQKNLDSDFHYPCKNPGMVALIYNPRAREVKTREPWTSLVKLQGQ